MTPATPQRAGRYLALCGGVGGVKLVLGLSRLLAAGQLTVVVNTGDDFEQFGLSISPDIDTVLYTLAGVVAPDQGWGRDEESFAALDIIGKLGGETWFRLGDKDLGLHLVRRTLLDQGLSLSAVTTLIAQRLGVAHEIAPMTDDTVRTLLQTDAGVLSFQEYFVKERCAPVLRGIEYSGVRHARPSPTLRAALTDPTLAGIFICPSNPYLSIGPILALPGILELLAGATAPVVAVSPIVGGRALKGPTEKIMRELAAKPSAVAVAERYAGFLNGYLVDPKDAVTLPGVAVSTCDIVMHTLEDKVALAGRCLELCDELRERP
jgi:LPPG:FO 2-phospho-L-lactate transferase